MREGLDERMEIASGIELLVHASDKAVLCSDMVAGCSVLSCFWVM